jgi:hypothetical protein
LLPRKRYTFFAGQSKLRIVELARTMRRHGQKSMLQNMHAHFLRDPVHERVFSAQWDHDIPLL